MTSDKEIQDGLNAALKPATLTEVWSRYYQLHAEAYKLIRDRAKELFNKVPESCKKFVGECCLAPRIGGSPLDWEVGAFTAWLSQLVENAAHDYGCDANMHASTQGWDVYGFQNSEEALAALKELEAAWEGNVTLEPEVLTQDGEVYQIEVLCKAVQG